MIARAHAASILGVDALAVTVEAEVGPGLPCLTVIGQTSGALSEARERVRVALGHCGHDLPPRKQVVNLAPAERRKDESGVDLAVACALLAGHGVVPARALEGVMLWGELALDGALRPAAGTLVVADCARRAGFHSLIVPEGAAREAALLDGLRVLPARDLVGVVAHLRGEAELSQATRPADDDVPAWSGPDMADVRGLTMPRRALEVMVAGGHNLLLFGPPGVGKTMLARRAAGLYPPLDREAALEVTKIHGVALGRPVDELVRQVPFRAPHHSVSSAGLLGGGSPPRPGEVSLAHRGLLFLDELLEFPRVCLEGLREPLEDGEVGIVRARYSVRIPARFQLMAAMNPCPCGFRGHPKRACVCSSAAIARYQQRLSGPLLDRMDLVVPVHPPSRTELSDPSPGESTASVRARVARARARQAERLAGTCWRMNAQIPASGDAMGDLCALTPAAARLLDRISLARELSPRARHRMRRVARTVADLRAPADHPAQAPIEPAHVAEAAHLRVVPDGAGGRVAAAEPARHPAASGRAEMG